MAADDGVGRCGCYDCRGCSIGGFRRIIKVDTIKYYRGRWSRSLSRRSLPGANSIPRYIALFRSMAVSRHASTILAQAYMRRAILAREGDRRREQWNCKGFDTVRGKNLKPHAMMGHPHRPRKGRMTGIDITALCDRGSGAGSWLAGLSSMTFYRN